MVRMVVGVLVLLIGAFVLLNLGKQQAQALQPAAAGASAPGSAANLPQKIQQDMQKALQQGAEQRASDANP
jgi:hypothetical protein